MNTNTDKPYLIPYFDGLRGVAAFVVLLAHMACAIYPALVSGTKDLSGLSILAKLARTPFSLFTAGNSAVCIFFVLSGYVMAMLSNRSNESFIAMSVRRYLRLAGPAVVSCLLSAWLLKHSLYFNQSIADVTASSWLKQWFLFNGHYHAALREGLISIFQFPNSTYNSNLWTLYTEFWGSLSIFFLFHTVKNQYLRLFSFLLGTLIVLFLYRHYGFFCMFAGATLFHIQQLIHPFFKTKRLNLICLLIGFFLCSYPDFAPYNKIVTYDWITFGYQATWYHSAGAILIVYFMHYSDIFKKIFSLPLFLWFGKISFSLYLIHLPIICSVGSLVISLSHSSLPYNVMSILFIIITTTVSLAFAQLYTLTIDKFFIRLGHWSSKKIDHYFPVHHDTPSPKAQTSSANA